MIFCFLCILFSAGKSSVLLDVKPWDDETDMKKLEEAVRSVEMEGLLWGACKFFGEPLNATLLFRLLRLIQVFSRLVFFELFIHL